MSVHQIQDYVDEAGEHRWRIVVLAPVPEGPNSEVAPQIVADSSEGYKNKEHMLASLFGLFFGTYDESFLTLYQEWNPEQYNTPNPVTPVNG